MSEIQSYRDLLAWQRAFALAVAAHQLCDAVPRTKRGSLVTQTQRAAASVPANIAEGSGRSGSREFRHGLSVAHGSLCELETQLLLGIDLGLCEAGLGTQALDQAACGWWREHQASINRT